MSTLASVAVAAHVTAGPPTGAGAPRHCPTSSEDASRSVTCGGAAAVSVVATARSASLTLTGTPSIVAARAHTRFTARDSLAPSRTRAWPHGSPRAARGWPCGALHTSGRSLSLDGSWNAAEARGPSRAYAFVYGQQPHVNVPRAHACTPAAARSTRRPSTPRNALSTAPSAASPLPLDPPPPRRHTHENVNTLPRCPLPSSRAPPPPPRRAS